MKMKIFITILILVDFTCSGFSWTLNVCILHQEGVFTSNSNLTHLLQDSKHQFQLQDKNSKIIFHTYVIQVSHLQLLQISQTGCTIIPSECHALITITDCSHGILVNSWASKYSLLNLLITDTSCSNTMDYGIKLTPYLYSVNEAVMAIIHEEEWNELVILHDDYFSPSQKLELVNHVSKEYIGIICLMIDHVNITTNINKHLSTIFNSQYRNILIIVHSDIISTLLYMAHKMSMLDSLYYWLIYSDSFMVQANINIDTNNSNIAILKRSDPDKSYDTCSESRGTCSTLTQEGVLKLRLLESMELLSKAFTEPDLSKIGQYTCSNNTENKQARTDISKKMLQTRVSRSLKFDSKGYPVGTVFNISSVHDRLNGGFDHVGYWSHSEGLVLTQNKVFLNMFSDFGNKTLIIGTLQAIPFTIKRTVGNRTIWEGFCIDILKEMASRFKFKYIISEPEDKLWGAPEDNGRWNGIVGEVVRGNYAFGVGPLTITSVRETVIDFTKPYTEEGIGILTRRPNSESKKMFKMFSPFAPQVWACIVAGVGVVSVLLYFVNLLSPYSDHKIYPQTRRMTFKESLWVVYGSYMEQGGEPHPRSISGRLILGFWWLFTILMASTYTANLAAFLTVTIAEKPINSLTELSEQEEIKPLAKYGSNLYTLFKDAKGGIYGEIWSQMEGMPQLKNNDDALEYVREGTTAFMTDRSQLEYIVLNDCETYSLADESFNTAGLGFIMPENAPFSDAFNYNIMKMQEAGLIDKWKQKWWPSSDKCSGSDRTSQAKTLDLESLAGPFLIFLSVAASAAILLFIEVCFYSDAISNCVKRLQISETENECESEK